MFQKAYIVAVLLFVSAFANAQQTEYYHEPDLLYKQGVELFNKEKYGAAQETFEKYLEEPDASPATKLNAMYYQAVCAYELFHPDAGNLLSTYLDEHPESSKTGMAHFYLARLDYREKKYRNAIPHFEKTDIYYLNNDEIAEYYFKMGYCYFVKADFEKASKSFSEITNVESKYQTAAQYYYAHIAYSNNNLNTALTSFQKLNSSETFGAIVPYYITQIYFEQGKYDELISYTSPIIEKGEAENLRDITRLTAESYYRKGDYKNAVEYFAKYKAASTTLSREDYYSIGYSSYKTGNYKAAIENLEKTVNIDDSLAQNAYYHLALSFLKTDNRQSARNSFQFASRSQFNPAIKEQSLLNYAKLSYELNFQPVAVNAFRDFIKEYPSSSSIDEANELLAGLYLTTRNYKDALALLENIKSRSGSAKQAYQKVAYYRGVEFYSDGDKDKAINMFEKAIINDVDPVLRAQAMYWKAEALYSQNKFDAAIKQYRIYIFNPGSINTPMYNLANYNMGYCYFKLTNYDESQTWFRKYIKNREETQKDKLDDANIRTGDCLYALRRFDQAVDFYNDAISSHAASADYALFQRGVMEGLQNNLAAKEQTMQQLLAQYKNSKYRADALYESGNTAMASGDNSKAIALFTQLSKDYPKSLYNSKAMLNTALIQYNDKQDEQALATYKKVIERYPGTTEASEALTGVKNIYVSNAKPDDYFAYLKTVPNTSVSAGAQDSITYEAAEQRYLKGNFDEASSDFTKYLAQFPQGAFRLNAVFYKAECDFRAKKYDDALTGYREIVAGTKNIYTEKSLAKAGLIEFSNKDYTNAIDHYRRLEETADMLDNILSAQTGLMRSYTLTGQQDLAVTYAQKLIANEKTEKEILNESHLTVGRAALESGDLTNAQKEMMLIAKQTGVTGAEAKFSLALIQYKLQNYKTSKDKCYEVINAVPSYDYWIGKSFILLADNYVALGDTFQAKHTLKSIVENYERSPSDKEDLKQVATQKLQALMDLEEQGTLLKEDEIEKSVEEDHLSDDKNNE
jgi:TolA-binding protein